jgi:hypothetical protein
MRKLSVRGIYRTAYAVLLTWEDPLNGLSRERAKCGLCTDQVRMKHGGFIVIAIPRFMNFILFLKISQKNHVFLCAVRI